MRCIKYIFVSSLVLCSELDKLFQAKCSHNNFEDNDVDALNAMMYFVQDREPSSFNDVLGE